ncbi:hypothetical protein D3C86_1902540 [compost metagenome]
MVIKRAFLSLGEALSEDPKKEAEMAEKPTIIAPADQLVICQKKAAHVEDIKALIANRIATL